MNTGDNLVQLVYRCYHEAKHDYLLSQHLSVFGTSLAHGIRITRHVNKGRRVGDTCDRLIVKRITLLFYVNLTTAIK